MTITISNSGTMFSGDESMRIYQAIAVKHALKLHSKGIKVNRHTTNKILLDLATNFTGKKYKRTDLMTASDDVAAWIDKARETADIRYE